jgi:hypothetical protein
LRMFLSPVRFERRAVVRTPRRTYGGRHDLGRVNRRIPTGGMR